MDSNTLASKLVLRDRFETILCKTQCTHEDIAWIRGMCETLQQRVCSLLKKRADLNDAFCRSFDIDIIINMVKHNAFEYEDSNTLVLTIFDRLSMCCAPVQDEAILHAKNTLLAESHIGRKMAALFEISQHVLDDIEKINADFHTKMSRLNRE